jgi:hypothetical protein
MALMGAITTGSIVVFSNPSDIPDEFKNEIIPTLNSQPADQKAQNYPGAHGFIATIAMMTESAGVKLSELIRS